MKRLVLVDVSHLAYVYSRIDMRMSAEYQGQTVDTRITQGILKALWKWTHHGQDDLVVCFDSKTPSRHKYVQESFSSPYKPNRPNSSYKRFILDGLDLTYKILLDAHTNLLQVPDFEADELIGIAIDSLGSEYDHIEVMTGDFDLIPLVDERVSIHLRSHKMSYTEDGAYGPKYYELTPDTYTDIPEVWSKCKGWSIPYNTMLLQKMLYGDESDGLPGVMSENGRRLYTKKKFAELVDRMISDGVPVSDVFRYRIDGQANLNDDVPSELTEVLDTYFDANVVPRLVQRYRAMNMNARYEGRKPYTLQGAPSGFDGVEYHKAANQIGVHLR